MDRRGAGEKHICYMLLYAHIKAANLLQRQREKVMTNPLSHFLLFFPTCICALLCWGGHLFFALFVCLSFLFSVI